MQMPRNVQAEELATPGPYGPGHVLLATPGGISVPLEKRRSVMDFPKGGFT